MRYLTLNQVLGLQRHLLERYGGAAGIHDLGALESALAQPRMTFGGEDLYPTIVEKAAALGFSLVKNHPFVDGNKRAGAVAAIVFLELNGSELDCAEQELEELAIAVAKGERQKPKIAAFLSSFSIPS